MSTNKSNQTQSEKNKEKNRTLSSDKNGDIIYTPCMHPTTLNQNVHRIYLCNDHCSILKRSKKARKSIQASDHTVRLAGVPEAILLCCMTSRPYDELKQEIRWGINLLMRCIKNIALEAFFLMNHA